jgi:methionyl-tRNA synthetase
MSTKYFSGEIMAPESKEEIDDELSSLALETSSKVEKFMGEYMTSQALEVILNLAKRCNKYIDETTPWILAKDETQQKRLGTVLYNLLEGIRFIAVLLSPFMPGTSNEILGQINCEINSFESLSTFGAVKAGTKVGTASPLFLRIDPEKMFLQIDQLNKDTQDNAKADEAEKLPQIGIDDFAKIDLRVAKVTECAPIKRSKNLLQLTLDDGSGIPRTVVSGIAAFYTPSDLIGHNVIVVANLKPAKLCGVQSCGMILAADTQDDNIRVVFADDLEIGAKVR